MSTREMACSVIDAMTEEQLKAFLMLFGNYKEPNQETLDAIEESEKKLSDPNAKKYDSLDELFEDLKS